MIKVEGKLLKKLQESELELMLEVDRVARKNNIRYSLDGGTLLGAVRHGGFIPWDDDADVMMTRDEYDKFYSACEKDLNKDKYFLQEFRTDENYRWGYSKLRKNGTVFLREGQEHVKCHQGVCIDIFIFDNVPDGMLQRRFHLLSCFLIRKGLYSIVGKYGAKSLISKLAYWFLSLFPRQFWVNSIERLTKKNADKTTELMSHYTYPNRKEVLYGLQSHYWDEYVDIDYEGHKLMAIKEYKRYLMDLFDDYMKLPPEDERKVHPVVELRLN